MNVRKNAALIALTALGLFFSGTAMANDLFTEVAPQHQVESCVAEISDYANYDDAKLVRHHVESKQRRTIGHILRIDTRVYGDTEDEVIREYATKCVVGISEKPLKFTIRELGDGA